MERQRHEPFVGKKKKKIEREKEKEKLFTTEKKRCKKSFFENVQHPILSFSASFHIYGYLG